MPEAQSFKIISFDGGGVRGLLSLALLERLEAAVPELLENADLLAGTSTGGILALALAGGAAPAELRAVYAAAAENIFSAAWWRKAWNLGRMRGAKYPAENLEREMRRLFGGKKLKDLRKHVLVPAFSLDNRKEAERSWAPKFFHNFAGPDSDGEQPLWKVALYTAAAPSYFPSADGYIDGGVAANNPAMAALALAHDARNFGGAPPQRVVLLSLGTGRILRRIEAARLDWGYLRWAKTILEIIFDGMTGIADYQCRQMLGGGYFRLSPELPPGIPGRFDDVTQMPQLAACAEAADLAAALDWLRAYWA